MSEFIRCDMAAARMCFRHVISGSLAFASLDRACRNLAPAFPQRSPPRRLAAAACGGLRSAPDCQTPRVDGGVAPPHPSQIRMCRFPASGSSWKSFAHEGVAMDDPGCRQRVTLSERSELVPRELTPAIPPRQPFLPNPRDLIGVPAYSSKVARYAVV